MNAGFKPHLGPDPKSSSESGNFAWFGPVEDGGIRFRYAVIREEGAEISIQPGEARFKKGLKALRWPDREGGTSTTWMVAKTRPNRIDLFRC